VRQRLRQLSAGLPDSWQVPADNWHLTLKFLGEQRDDLLAPLGQGLASIKLPAFELSLVGAGFFGSPRRPRILWAGLAESEALKTLQQQVENVCVQHGFARETRDYCPHITLARGRGGQFDPVAWTEQQQAAVTMSVNEFCLYQSLPGRQGVSYPILQRYPLLA